MELQKTVKRKERFGAGLVYYVLNIVAVACLLLLKHFGPHFQR